MQNTQDYTFDYGQGYINNTGNGEKLTFDYRSTQPKTYQNSKPTSKQISYYVDLCRQRRMQPKPIKDFTFETMAKEIEEVLAYYPASDAQIRLIESKIQNIRELIFNNMNFTEEQVEQLKDNKSNIIAVIIVGLMDNTLNIPIITEGLTGGREGTASKLIERLINVENKFNDLQRITEPQIQQMVSMFLCPDVAFEEDLGITRRVELEGTTWRKCTPQEFAQQLSDKVTKSQASLFIDKHRGVFHNWKQTRIRPEQIRYIRTLEERMGNIVNSTAVEYAVMQDGSITEIRKKADRYDGTAYVGLEDTELMMLSKEQASQFIDRLKWELELKDFSDTGLQLKSEQIEIRKPQTQQDAIERDYEELKNLIYRLEAIAGYSDDELHDAVNINLITEEDPESQAENKEKIRAFLADMVDSGAIDFEYLLDICGEHKVLQRILLKI